MLDVVRYVWLAMDAAREIAVEHSTARAAASTLCRSVEYDNAFSIESAVRIVVLDAVRFTGAST